MALSCSWSDLPQEVLELILENLNEGMDVLRCGFVCASWRMAVSEVYRKFIPLLLITNNEDSCTFFNLSTDERRIIQLPEIYSRLVCGSTNGWLVTMDFAWPHRIQLLNPLSRKQIDLPLISRLEFQELHEYSIISLVEGYIKRAITSRSPLEQDCVVLVIYGVDHQLAFCKPGDERWTDLDALRVVDIMVYKGRLYATDSYGNIECWELDPNPVAVLIVNTAKSEPGQKYLVESLSGDFWLVFRNHNWEDNEDDDGDDIHMSSLTTSFEVFKLDRGTMEWREVKSLGDQALFLGRNGSISVSTGYSREFWRGNCIYFIDNSKGGYFVNGFNCLMAYDTENKHLEQLYQSEIWRSQFHWITPDV